MDKKKKLAPQKEGYTVNVEIDYFLIGSKCLKRV